MAEENKKSLIDQSIEYITLGKGVFGAGFGAINSPIIQETNIPLTKELDTSMKKRVDEITRGKNTRPLKEDSVEKESKRNWNHLDIKKHMHNVRTTRKLKSVVESIIEELGGTPDTIQQLERFDSLISSASKQYDIPVDEIIKYLETNY